MSQKVIVGKQITMPLDEWESNQAEMKRLRGVNSELASGKVFLVTRDIKIESGVVAIESNLSNFYTTSVYDLFRPKFESNLGDVSFDFISKHSHDEIVGKLTKELESYSFDAKSEFEKIDIERGGEIKRLALENEAMEKKCFKLFKCLIVSMSALVILGIFCSLGVLH